MNMFYESKSNLNQQVQIMVSPPNSSVLTMLLLRRDESVYQEILKEHIFSSRNGDLMFITKNGRWVSDKVLVFHYFPILKTFQCDKCVNSHDQTTIVITHVKTNKLKTALYQLFMFGNASPLSHVLSIPVIQNKNIFDQTTLAIPNDNQSVNETGYESIHEDLTIGKPSFESTQVDLTLYISLATTTN